jgi:tetratricopeptide (TPR) repeat protein
MNQRCVHGLILILFLCGSVLGWPQKGSSGATHPGDIHGQVRLPDGRPAPLGLLVSLEMQGGGTAGQTQTDRQGKFDFRQVAPAQYEVTIRAFGYRPETQTADLTIIPSAYLTFNLKLEPGSKDPSIPPEGPGATISAPLDPDAPDDARKDLESGRAILSGGKDLDKSIRLFQKAIVRYPQYSEAYLLLGVAYSSQKKWDDAEKALQKTIELNQNVGGAYVALGSVENEKKAYPKAEKYLLKAVELSPGSADAHFELGRAYWGLQRWDVADQHVAKANEQRPGNAGQHVLLGNILLRERDVVGALKEFKQAVQLDPQGSMAGPTRQMIDRIEAALKQAENQKK